MADLLILAAVIALTGYIVFRFIRNTKKGKCSGCNHSCNDCPSAKKK